MKKPFSIFAAILSILLSIVIIVGCQQQVEPAPPVPAPTTKLAIRNIQLCSSVSDDGDYIVQPGATFDHGDVVWLYFEARGMTAKGVEGKFEYWWKFSELKLFDPNDDMIERMVDFVEMHDADLDEPPNFVWFYALYESTTDDAAGQYRWEFTVKDGLSGAIGTGSATFTLQ